MGEKTAPVLADDATEKIPQLVKLRLPWLLSGLLGGIVTVLFIGQFERLLNEQVQLAFFVPIVVYLSDAVGTQTEDIYIRNMARKRTRFVKYLPKEMILGWLFGAVFGIATGIFAFLWLGNGEVAFAVSVSLMISVSVATIVALIIPTIFYREHTDPAVSAGPIKTVVQDFISILVYFLVAYVVVFS